MEKKLYIVIIERSRDDLLEKVNDSMQEGYEPLGGIACDDNFLYQAMAVPVKSRVDFLRGKRRLNDGY
jgi:hypothetical protein